MIREEGKGQRIVKVTPDFIQAAIKEKNEDIPDDVRITGHNYNIERSVFEFLLESDEWEEGYEGEKVFEIGFHP